MILTGGKRTVRGSQKEQDQAQRQQLVAQPSVQRAILQMQQTMGNRSTARYLSAQLKNRSAAQAESAQAVVQRMILPIKASFPEMDRKKGSLSEGDKVIYDAIKKRSAATNESIADPTDEASWIPWNNGALAAIGNEELRIFGHGARFANAEEVAQIDGHTPEQLAEKLINLGLPKKYAGVIYLSGCNTARGEKHGYLGKFYQLIKKHCKNVRVRGNLHSVITRMDGEQAYLDQTRFTINTYQQDKESIVSAERKRTMEAYDLLIQDYRKGTINKEEMEKQSKLLKQQAISDVNSAVSNHENDAYRTDGLVVELP